MADLQAEWMAETARLFDALVTEQRMVMDDTEALRLRVMSGYVVDPPDLPPDLPPDPPVETWVPPVIAISANAATVKEG